MYFLKTIAILTFISPFLPVWANEHVDCASILVDAEKSGDDLAELANLHSQAQRHCDPVSLDALSTRLGNTYFNAAVQSSGQEQKSLLIEAAKFGKDWRIFAALGELQLRDGERDAAAQNLQWAILALRNSPPAQSPPAQSVRKLITMANNARAVADTYVRVLRNRSDQPDGVAANDVSGVVIEAVPFPIEFVFGESTLTEAGIIGAEDLADILAAEETATITLAGHTDPTGSDSYNHDLSLRRAEAVRDFLVEAGIGKQMTIEVIACGESYPAAIESPEFYSEDEIHQIMRRVELLRTGDTCS